MTLPAGFGVALDPGAWLDGDVLFGGAPFRVVTLTPRQRATVGSWLAGGRVGADGVLARALVAAGWRCRCHPRPTPTPADGRG